MFFLVIGVGVDIVGPHWLGIWGAEASQGARMSGGRDAPQPGGSGGRDAPQPGGSGGGTPPFFFLFKKNDKLKDLCDFVNFGIS